MGPGLFACYVLILTLTTLPAQGKGILDNLSPGSAWEGHWIAPRSLASNVGAYLRSRWLGSALQLVDQTFSQATECEGYS